MGNRDHDSTYLFVFFHQVRLIYISDNFWQTPGLHAHPALPFRRVGDKLLLLPAKLPLPFSGGLFGLQAPSNFHNIFFRSTERQPPIIDYFAKNNKKISFTDSGKIEWWLKNRDMLKEKYDTPEPESDGSFTVVFWLFGEGYKEEGKYDRRCFEDMKTQKNCIDKNSLILVKNSKNSGMYYILDSGTYRTNDAGEIIKNKSD